MTENNCLIIIARLSLNFIFNWDQLALFAAQLIQSANNTNQLEHVIQYSKITQRLFKDFCKIHSRTLQDPFDIILHPLPNYFKPMSRQL